MTINSAALLSVDASLPLGVRGDGRGRSSVRFLVLLRLSIRGSSSRSELSDSSSSSSCWASVRVWVGRIFANGSCADFVFVGALKSKPLIRSLVSPSSSPRDLTSSVISSAVTLTPCLNCAISEIHNKNKDPEMALTARIPTIQRPCPVRLPELQVLACCPEAQN